MKWTRLLVVMLISLSGLLLERQAQALDAQTEVTMNTVLDHYLTIQEKLSSDTTAGIEGEAQWISKKISEFFRKPCKPEDASCASVMQKILSAAQSMKGSDIKRLRKSFQDLSQAMVEYWEKFSPKWNDVFVFRCPMADENKGAPWLQRGSDLKNPYFGKAMQNCGLPVK